MGDVVIGIDPGIKGGVGAIGDIWASAFIMPLTDESTIDGHSLGRLIANLEPRLVVIEKVHSMPKQGVASTFKFGTGFGKIQGVCEALQLSLDFQYILVTPQQWKKVVLCGLDWKGNKLASVAYVRRKYPGVGLLPTKKSRKHHDGMADALCLAEYGLSIK